MESRSLKEKLIQAVDQYLHKDNPDPSSQSIPGRIYTFFAGRGHAGRARALQYKSRLEKTQLDDESLCRKVFRELKTNGMPFDTSKQLRKRIMQALSDYLGIGNVQINREIRKSYRHITTGMYGGGGYALASQIHMNVLRKLITEKLSSSIKENTVVFNAIHSNQL